MADLGILTRKLMVNRNQTGTFSGGPNSLTAIEPGAYPDILFYWGCESTTAEKSGGDTTASLQSSAAINTDIKAVGTASLDMPTSYDRVQFDYSTGVINKDEGRIGFYLYFDTKGSGAGLFTMSYDANNTIQLYVTTNDLTMNIKIAGTGGTLLTTGANLTASPGPWFFIEFAWKLSTNYREIFVNGASKASSTSALGDVWAGDPTTMTFGEWAGVTNDMHMDQILISNDSTRDLYALRDQTSF